ncbi:MFS transporter [Amycolatopsis coloradensis]|uniref:MFS transporter n=1 Tax=Amycolatopsis coloradensis TaxID=76021 RepID=A0ACD5BJM0_9PSEU
MTPLDLRTTPRIHHPRRWAALVPALLACYMDLLDATIVTVALPAFEEDLGAGPATLQWTSAGYTLAFAVLLITGGRVGDIYGRKRTFVTGMAVFLLTSVLCGLARNPEMLVVSRVLQGAAAAMMIPQVLSFIQVEFPSPERPRALAMYGISLALGGMTGPVLGGLLIQADIAGLGWRAVFLINLPVGAAALLGALRLMPESRSGTAPKLDLVGVLLVTAALVAVMYPLVQGHETGWPLWTFLSFVAVMPILLFFSWHQRFRERSGGTPLIPARMSRHRSLRAGLPLALIFFAGTGHTFVFSLYLQQGLGYSSWRTGLTLFPSSLGIIAGSMLSIRLAPRLGRRVVSIAALVKIAGVVGVIYPIHVLGPALTPWALVPGAIVLGTGMAMVSATLVNIVLSKVPVQDAGAASGLMTTALQVGSAISIAVLGTVFFGSLTGTGDHRQAIEACLWVCVALFFASFVMSFLLPPGGVPATAADDRPPSAKDGGIRRSIPR